jgi:Glycosyl transferase family 2
VSAPRLSIVLATAHAWPGAKAALDSARDQDCDAEFEILFLDGHGAALDREPDPPVRWFRAPGKDGFELRALGFAEARGDVVAITEDHCVMLPDWCRRILAAHERNPAAVLVGAVANHPDSARRAVDRANFLLTFGPFSAPIEPLTSLRLPVPTNISFKRSALSAPRFSPGWIEYGLLAELRERGEIELAPDVLLQHRQSWGALRALLVHFSSGRSYGASTRMTLPALERGAGGAVPGAADRIWLKALILANALGQLTGSIAGPGRSRRRLI